MPKRLGEPGDMPYFCLLVIDFRGLKRHTLALLDRLQLDGRLYAWLCGLLDEMIGCRYCYCTLPLGFICGYAVFSKGW